MNIIQRVKTMLFGDKLKKLREMQNHYNYRRALELLNKEDDEAIEFLRKEVEECPENGYAQYGIGHMNFGHRRLGEALKSVNDAIRHLQGDDEWLNACFYLRAQINQELGNEQQMLDDLATAINYRPENPKAYEMRADYYYQKHDYERSDKDYARMAEIAPADAFPVAALGRSLLAQGAYDEARKKFEYSIKLEPEYATAYAFLADCKLKQGDEMGCIDDCLTSMKLNPSEQKAMYLLMVGVTDQYFPTLKTRLEVLSQTEPNNAHWLYVLGVKHKIREEYYEAIKCYRTAYRIDPHSNLLVNIADVYTALYDFRRAEVYYRQALESRENDINVHHSLATSLLHQARFVEALQEYEKCDALQPGNVEILIDLSAVNRILSNFDEARTYAEKAISLAPSNSTALLTLSRIYEMTGQEQEQRQFLEKIVSLEDPKPRDKAVALALLGRSDEAIALLEENYVLQTRCQQAAYYLDRAYILSKVGKADEAREALSVSFDLGMRDFEVLIFQDILTCMAELPGFFDLYHEAENRMNIEFLEQNRLIYQDEEDQGSDRIEAVPFVPENGLCKVVGEVNGLPLSFVFDTGASDVTLSTVEATFMKKNGYLEERDFGGSVNYMTASGEVAEGTIINLRQIKVGHFTLSNVRATVIRNQHAPLLLGQSVLNRYAKVEVDNESRIIRFTHVNKMVSPDEVRSSARYEYNRGNYLAAAQLYRAAYTASEDVDDIQMEAFSCLAYGAAEKALQIANEAKEAFPESADVRYLYANTLYYTGRIEETIEAFRQNVILDEQSFLDWYLLSYILARIGRHEEAIAVAEEGLQHCPDCRILNLQRAQSLERLGRADEAKADYELVALEPFTPGYSLIAAEALLHLGRHDECRANIQSSMAEAMQYAPVYSSVVQIDAAEYYAEMGDEEEARRLFIQYLEGPTRTYYPCIRSQYDYYALRNLPDFEETMQRYESKLAVDLAALNSTL